MSAAVLNDVTEVARVGFDHGWYMCGPTFLNLGLPLLLVDQLFLGDPDSYGLEVLGSRNPRLPLPSSTLRLQRSGRFVALSAGQSTEPIAIGAFADQCILDHLDRTDDVAVALCDTWAVQQSWCALFRSAIGTATQLRCRPNTTFAAHATPN